MICCSLTNLIFIEIKKYQTEEFETQPTHKKERRSKNDTVDSEEEEEEFLDKENYKRPTDLFEEGIDVEGKALFGFRTPGKKGAMHEYAANTPKSHKKTEDVVPSTPKSSRKSLLKNPETPRNTKNLMHSINTPKFLKSPGRKLDMQATPKAEREKNKRSKYFVF